MEKQEKKSSGIWIGLSVVQFLIIVFLAYMLMNQKDEITNLNTDLTTTGTELENTSKDLFDMRDQLIEQKKKYKELGFEKEGLDKQIAELDQYISKLKNNIAMSDKEKKQLKSFVAQLQQEIAQKDVEIKNLMVKNDSLVTEIDTLNVEKQLLNEELSTVTIAKSELNDFIKAASVLHVDEMAISALKANGKEFMKEEYKASSIDRLRIKFTLADNKAAQKDNKVFYIRLILPSGDVFSDKLNGGGSILLDNGNEVKYSMSQNVRFTNSGQELVFTMLKGFNYSSGNYIVEVVCEGNVIGSGYFNVK